MCVTKTQKKETRSASSLMPLLDCPFCGGNKDLHIAEKYSRDKTITWYRILHGPQNRCSVSMIDSDKNELIERWNIRAIITTD